MENEEPKETQDTENNQGTPEILEAIKSELDTEKKAEAAAEAALAEKDARIAELQAEGVAISEARDQAVAKYLDAVRHANPALPQDIIAGDTIEDIDASLAQANAIAEHVRASLEAEAKNARVPAGAPPRVEISVEGLSPREKIAAGIQQKGGM